MKYIDTEMTNDMIKSLAIFDSHLSFAKYIERVELKNEKKKSDR